MLALGLNIVVGFAGLLDLGYIAFFAVGAYCYALLASPQFGIHWPFLPAAAAGRRGRRLFGVLLGAPTLRLRGDYLAIVTLGFGEIIRIFLNNLNRPVNITNGPQGITLIDPLQIGGFSLARPHTLRGPDVRARAQLLLRVPGLRRARRSSSRCGWRIRASAAPGSPSARTRLAAEAMGINTRNVKLLAFAMGATFGGVCRRAVRVVPGLRQPGELHPDRVHHDPVHGGAGRHGQRPPAWCSAPSC